MDRCNKEVRQDVNKFRGKGNWEKTFDLAI